VALFLGAARPELAVISVQANDGIVELTGVVPSFYLRQLAIACARRVAGVREVIDHIHVEDAGRPGPSDAGSRRGDAPGANDADSLCKGPKPCGPRNISLP
jgi:osmotically-inducible protein OsmY